MLVLLIRWGASKVLFFSISQFDWPITRKVKEIEILEAPQNIWFLCEGIVPPFWPIYMGEKVKTLGKPYGIKLRIFGKW